MAPKEDFLYKFWLLRRSYPRQQRFLRPPDLPSKGMLVVLPSPSFVVTRSGVVKLFLTFSLLEIVAPSGPILIMEGRVWAGSGGVYI